MSFAISKISGSVSRKNAALVMLLFYAPLLIITLNSYIQWQSVNFITGAVAIPLIGRPYQNKTSSRYGIFALIFSLLALINPINTILYFAFVFTILFIVEAFYGKTNFLLFLLLIFLSPVFQYFINVFSFPIRLRLTQWSGNIMDILGIENDVQGNIIFRRGNEYSVDPSCMGLNMLLLSMIISVIILSRHENILQSKRSFLWIILTLIAALLFNITANLIRIILIVQFKILPGTTLHDVTGVVCFLVYIILPVHFFTKGISLFVVQKSTSKKEGFKAMSYEKMFFTNLFLATILILASFKNNEFKKGVISNWSDVRKVGDYSAQNLPQQTLKLEKKGFLVYIKKIPAFYNADHTPYICWKGSGYTFQNIIQEKIGGIQVYSGKLKNNNDELFTAWWYQSKDKSTIDQFRWRWDMLTTNRNYCVVNVTAANKEDLAAEISNLISNKKLAGVIK